MAPVIAIYSQSIEAALDWRVAAPRLAVEMTGRRAKPGRSVELKEGKEGDCTDRLSLNFG